MNDSLYNGNDALGEHYYTLNAFIFVPIAFIKSLESWIRNFIWYQNISQKNVIWLFGEMFANQLKREI